MPTCNPRAPAIFGGGPDCEDRWNTHTYAVQQRRQEELLFYVNRQKELASHTSAPSQQQIADLNRLISDQQERINQLQEQMQADSIATLHAESAAHNEGLQEGAAISLGAALLLIGLVFGIKRLRQSLSEVQQLPPL